MRPPRPLKILQVVASLDRTWGGLSLYVAELAAELASLGHHVQVVCQTWNSSEAWPSGGAEVVAAAPGSALWESLREAADLIHVHGLWLPFCHKMLAGARRQKTAHLLSVHGMLEPGALRFSRWKKRAALWLYQRRDLRMTGVLHATAEPELRTLRAFGLRQPIVTLPSGVRLPTMEENVSPTGAARKALFLGRIHPKKGILTLIDAWSAARPPGWKLVLAGPDESGHLAEVRQRLRDLRLEGEVSYHGPAFGEAKDRLLRESSLLVAPSISENFGIVIAEGLSYGLPVITTVGTPWRLLERERCGWWIALGVDPLVTALREATALAPERLVSMGRRGRMLTQREFGWPRIADQMSAVYSWLTGEGSRPEWVRAI